MSRQPTLQAETRSVTDQIARHATQVRDRTGPVDCLTFVSDGKPTLDANLGAEIELVRPMRKGALEVLLDKTRAQ